MKTCNSKPQMEQSIKRQLKTFPHDWRKRLLAIGIYRDAVSANENINTSANKLGISPIFIVLASTALKIRKRIF